MSQSRAEITPPHFSPHVTIYLAQPNWAFDQNAPMALVYSQLFDSTYDKDEGLYKVLFTTPLVEDALQRTIMPNIQRVVEERSQYNQQVFVDLLRYGVTFFNDAIQYQTQTSADTASSADAAYDGDITLQKQDSNTNNTPVRRRQFEDIDDELRAELVANILHTVQTWFLVVYDSIKLFRRDGPSDLLLMLFGEKGPLDSSIIEDLLVRMKWVLRQAIDDISTADDTPDEYLQLPVIKEIILVVALMLRCIFLLLAHNLLLMPIKRLLATFDAVDFTESFNRLLVLTAAEKSTEDGKETFLPPKIRLSAETLVILYSVIGSLAHVERHISSRGKQLLTVAADITTLDNGITPRRSLITNKEYTRDLFQREIGLRIIPILAMEFNYGYLYRPDLLLQQLPLTLFFGWLTGNTFGKSSMYGQYDTQRLVTNFETPECALLSIYGDENDPYIVEVRHILQTKFDRRRYQLNTKEFDDILEMPELLPISLVLFLLLDNPTFVEQLLTPELPITRAIEDLDPMEDRDMGVLEMWLCVVLYVLQYHYRLRHFQLITKLTLYTVAKLCSLRPLPLGIVPATMFGAYRINEFKWKLCHQRLPIVPIDEGSFGIKLALFYTLDVLQNLLRFNLTNKLKLDNFQVAVNVMYQVVTEIKRDTSLELGHYHWDQLRRLIFSTIQFFVKQRLWELSHFINLHQEDNVKAVIEELLVVVDSTLCPRFSYVVEEEDQLMLINYNLVYNILLHYDLIKIADADVLGSSLAALMPRLAHCLHYFEEKIHLTEESKLLGEEKLNMQDYSYDSYQLKEMINGYLLDRDLEVEVPTTPPTYLSKETLKYATGNFELLATDSLQIINFALAPDNKPMLRFFQERAGEDQYRVK